MTTMNTAGTGGGNDETIVIRMEQQMSSGGSSGQSSSWVGHAFVDDADDNVWFFVVVFDWEKTESFTLFLS